jgi:hypothetical protein
MILALFYQIQDDGSVKQELSKRLWNITESFGIFRPTDMEAEVYFPLYTCNSKFTLRCIMLIPKYINQYQPSEFRNLLLKQISSWMMQAI